MPNALLLSPRRRSRDAADTIPTSPPQILHYTHDGQSAAMYAPRGRASTMVDMVWSCGAGRCGGVDDNVKSKVAVLWCNPVIVIPCISLLHGFAFGWPIPKCSPRLAVSRPGGVALDGRDRRQRRVGAAVPAPCGCSVRDTRRIRLDRVADTFEKARLRILCTLSLRN